MVTRVFNPLSSPALTPQNRNFLWFKHLWCPFFLCALTALPLGSEPESPKQAVRTFEKAMKQGISPVVLLALQNLAHHDAPVCVEAILDIFAAQEVAFFPAARRILAGYRHCRRSRAPDPRKISVGGQSRQAV